MSVDIKISEKEKKKKKIDFKNFNSSAMALIDRRVRALKKIQFEKLKVDGQLAEEVMKLQSKFQNQYESLNKKRKDIISGEVEPNDEECDFTLDLDSDQELSDNSNEILDNQIKGIPGFWLIAMKNVRQISDWIEAHDEPVLYHLKHIDIQFDEKTSKLIFEFSFDSNQYFTNEVLTKEYKISFGPNPENLWDLNGFYVTERKGCQIEWKEGENVTQKIRTNKKSGKSKASLNTSVKIDSFFDFFDPPNDEELTEEEMQDFLEDDWSLGKLFYHRFVPNAVLYFSEDLFEDEDESESSDSETDSTDDSV